MKAKFAALAAAAALLALAGCETAPSHFPVTYQIPIGNSQVTSAYGPQNLNVSGTQEVPVTPGMTLYYQALAPVNLSFYAFDKEGPGPGGPVLNQSQGTFFNGSVVPHSNAVQFVFSAAQANTGGTVQFTVSDRPIASPVAAPMPTAATVSAPGAPSPAVSVTPTQ